MVHALLYIIIEIYGITKFYLFGERGFFDFVMRFWFLKVTGKYAVMSYVLGQFIPFHKFPKSVTMILCLVYPVATFLQILDTIWRHYSGAEGYFRKIMPLSEKIMEQLPMFIVQLIIGITLGFLLAKTSETRKILNN